MQASAVNTLRLAARQSAKVAARRSLATTANLTGSHSTPASTSSTAAASAPVPLGNVEALWNKLSVAEKQSVHEQLEELQKKDWKGLSLDEKKAAYYVAFGPHGARAPMSKPGDNYKIFFSVLGLVGVTAVLAAFLHSKAAPPPKTLTTEWEEATNERALQMKLNPITGISSEGYSGKGFVTK